MEIINLSFLCLFLYVFSITSFFTKIISFIFFSSLVSVFINLEKFKNSTNPFSKIIYLTFSFLIFIFNSFILILNKVKKLNFIKYIILCVNNLNRSYIEGRNYIFFSFVNLISNSYKKIKSDMKKESETKKTTTFKDDNDMFDFLDNLENKND